MQPSSDELELTMQSISCMPEGRERGREGREGGRQRQRQSRERERETERDRERERERETEREREREREKECLVSSRWCCRGTPCCARDRRGGKGQGQLFSEARLRKTDFHDEDLSRFCCVLVKTSTSVSDLLFSTAVCAASICVTAKPADSVQ